MTTLGKPITIVSLILASIGLLLSTYLTYVHYNMDALVCGSGGCELVQTSAYSTMLGIPIAIFGLVMFITLIVAIVMREFREDWADLISTGILMILVSAVLYWAYLTYIELNVIHAVCEWCVATSIATVILMGVEGFRWYRGYKSLGNS